MVETWNSNIPEMDNLVAEDIPDINENLAYLLARAGYRVDVSEADQGSAGGGNSLKDLVDSIGADKLATILFSHSGGGNTTTYTLSTSEAVPSNIYLDIEPGALIVPDADVTLTVYSPDRIIASPRQQIIDMTNNSTNPLGFTNGGTVYAEWFGPNTTPGTTDMSEEIQSANDSMTAGRLKFGSEIYGIGTGLTWKQNIEYVGDGKGATTIKALAAIDMVTIANNQYHYTVDGILFDGDSAATTGLKLGDTSVQSGFASIKRVEVKDCTNGIDAGWFFNTDFTQVYIHDNSAVGIEINKGQGNRIQGWFYDNGTDALFTAIQDSSIDIVSYNTASRLRSIRLTGASHYNFITGAFETQDDHTGGDVILIDGQSQSNQIIGASFYANTDSNADADDLDFITVGDSTDGGPVLGTIIKENKFFGLDSSSYYHVNIQYGSQTVIADNRTSETGSAVLINEPVQEKAAQTKYIPLSNEGKILTTAVSIALTPQHMDQIVYVDCTGGARTITLPMCEVVDGGELTIMKVDAGGNAVTVAREAGTERFLPGGATSDSIAAQYNYVTYRSNGTDWVIMEER